MISCRRVTSPFWCPEDRPTGRGLVLNLEMIHRRPVFDERQQFEGAVANRLTIHVQRSAQLRRRILEHVLERRIQHAAVGGNIPAVDCAGNGDVAGDVEVVERVDRARTFGVEIQVDRSAKPL